MAEIRLTGVNKVYPDGTHAVHDVDLHIADGEFMIMVGPSGCAKSTILRMIAGLETPTHGSVEIGGRVVNDVAPKDRDIAMVFQSYALYPHMTVRENMAFGLRLRRMPPSEIDQRVAEAARILGLEHLLDRLPKAMSGGQRQRVAMGRAIVREPQAFLMDEPLSNLDAKLRVQMRTEIAKLHQRLSTTTVYVTHDQVEAMTLGQRICILRKGVVQQVDTPFQVYQNPNNVFVGGFIGSPGMNFMNGHLVLHEGALYVQLGDRHLPLPATVTSRLTATTDLHGRGVIVGIRPEHLSATADGDPMGLPVHVELTEAMGAEVYAYFTAAVTAPDLTALADTQASSSTFVARLPAGAETRGGEQILLRPDLDEVHLFDPTSLQTLLVPADEHEVRSRQAGRAIQLAGGTASRGPGHVAAPPSTTVLQPMQPVIHLHQTFVPSETAPHHPVSNRIESVFDQPVASPIGLEPLVPVAATGTDPGPTTGPSHPRPTFAGQVAGGTSLDPATAPSFGLGGRQHASGLPWGANPGASSGVLADAAIPEAAAETTTPEPSIEVPMAVEAVVAEPIAPAPRGFAPRIIGPGAIAAAPAVQFDDRAPTLDANDAGLDAAIGALEQAEAVVAVAAPFEAPATGVIARSAGFREALERIRNPAAAAPLGMSTPEVAGSATTEPKPLVVRPPLLGGSPGEPTRN